MGMVSSGTGWELSVTSAIVNESRRCSESFGEGGRYGLGGYGKAGAINGGHVEVKEG